LRLAGLKKARKASAVAKRTHFTQTYAGLFPVVSDLREQVKTLQEIADGLKEMRYQTVKGEEWNPMQVSRLLKKAAA